MHSATERPHDLSVPASGAASNAAARLARALAPYDAALRKDPGRVDVLNAAASLCLQAGELLRGISYLDASLGVQPGQAMLHAVRGVARSRLGDLAGALQDLDRAIELQPGFAAAHFDRACVLRQLGRMPEALVEFEAAIALKPNYAEAFSNRGGLLKELGRLEEARASCDEAIRLDADYAPAYFNRAAICCELGEPEVGLADCRAGKRLAPNESRSHLGEAIVLELIGELGAAIEAYDRALTIDPAYAEARWNRATLLLLLGRMEEGWREYESRWASPQTGGRRAMPGALWTGQEPLAGKSIFVHLEQGAGDFLQFCRYVPELIGRGATVFLEVRVPLARLAKSLAPSCELVAEGQMPESVDWHIPLLSLPLAFETTLDRVPAAVPYLTVPEEMRERWRQRLGPRTKPRVGIAWAGAAAFGNDRNRSIALASCLPLFGGPLGGAFEFHCLQREIRDVDRAIFESLPIALHASELDDFAETAALILEMDLVISVDTAVAHLAGALAQPVWILLPFKPDFRWMLARADSPWYPSARLFRQSRRGDWESVIAAIGQALAQERFTIV